MVYVYSHLQYFSSVWSSFTVADKELLESVKCRAVNMITNIRVTNEQKLSQLGLTSLEENKKRGDMVEFYKMMTGKTRLDFLKMEPVLKGFGQGI